MFVKNAFYLIFARLSEKSIWTNELERIPSQIFVSNEVRADVRSKFASAINIGVKIPLEQKVLYFSKKMFQLAWIQTSDLSQHPSNYMIHEKFYTEVTCISHLLHAAQFGFTTSARPQTKRQESASTQFWKTTD